MFGRALAAALTVVVGLQFQILADQHTSVDTDKTLSPYFWAPGGDPSVDQLPLRSTEVSAAIAGVMADVTVTQRYCNTGTRPINARYVFPASTRAAVHGMTMRVAGHVIKAVIKEREEAVQTFEKAKKEGKSASLLQQQRPNVFTMDVANVMPGDTIDIELRYTELLAPTEGVYEFTYPTVVGPRYSSTPEYSATSDETWVKSPYLKKGEADPATFSIAVDLAAGLPLRDIGSPSHTIDVAWESESRVYLTLAPSAGDAGNRDVILRYRLAGAKIQSGLMLFEGTTENYFLLMAQPPRRVTPAQIPAREYVFVIDVSGSMRGFPLDITKTLMRELIGSLRSTDLFNVVLFAGDSRLMSSTSLPATSENVDRAVRLIDSESGGGGTELSRALRRSLDLPRNPNVSRSIVVVTDGYISAEMEAFELIHDNLGTTNVFAFGIGSGVNRYLIEGIARAGKGEPFVVTKPQKAAAEARRFRTYIQSPVLTGISVETDGLDVYDVEPPRVPDMLAERPVVVCGKWRGPRRGRITVRGVSGDGFYSQTFDAARVKPTAGNRALEYLWARTRISSLSDYNFGRPTKEQADEVTRLGLAHSLLTQYTSFVAVCEKVRNADGTAVDVAHPSPLPKGVENSAVGTHGTPEPGLVALVLFVVFLGGWVVVRRRLGVGTSA